MARILTVNPNTLLDFVAYDSQTHERLRTVSRVQRFRTVAGGKGVNVGRVLARHGHQVTVLGFAGGKTGEMVSDLISSDGMNPVLVPTESRTRVGFELIENSGVTAVLEDGFVVTAAEVDAFIKQAGELLPVSDLVMIGGSMPSDSCRELIVRVLQLCALQKIECWVDSYGPAMQVALHSDFPPRLAKPNLDEFGNGKGFDFCPEVHVTKGSEPIMVRTPEGLFRVTPAKIVEKNSIGSGDCYLAALAHARFSGKSIEEQLRYAAAAGTANAALGASTFIEPENIESYLDQVIVTRLS